MIKVKAWEGWYHCTGNTKSTWLLGDPRGSRTRHHRQHIEGDYKNPPPPGKYDELLKRSKRLLKREPVILNAKQREFVCKHFGEHLLVNCVEMAQLSVGPKHWHLLARFGRKLGKQLVGAAKGFSARMLSKAGLIDEGGVWAARCKIFPVKSQKHFARLYVRYIPDHRKQQSVLYTDLVQAEKARRNPKPRASALGL